MEATWGSVLLESVLMMSEASASVTVSVLALVSVVPCLMALSRSPAAPLMARAEK